MNNKVKNKRISKKDRERALSAALELEKLYPDAACSLDSGGDPWRLLVMARLSAQCTDERVNIISKDLFSAIPDVKAMADTPIERIEELIRSCGLYRSKAKSLKESANQILENFAGCVPDNMEDLLSLSGVGRKIANLIMGDVFHKGGIVADTHCMRICGRLGFYPEDKKDPLFTERIMTPLIPSEMQSDFCHRLVLFGRDVCTARSPRCSSCPLAHICKHITNA